MADAVRSTGPGGPSWRDARLVAGIIFRDLVRRPGGWVATLLTATLFALLVGALGISGDRGQDRIENRSFRIAVGGDIDGARAVLDQLRVPRLVLVESIDVAGDVTASRASAGIEFPPDTDRRLDAGEAVEVRLFVRQSATASQEAFNTLAVQLQQIELERAAGLRGSTVETGGEATILIEDLPRDALLNRIQLARQIAPIGALLCIGVITSVASVLGAAKERRTIEPLLVLPISRSSLSFGIALGAYPLACLQLLVASVLLVATAAIPSSSAQQPAASLLAMFVGALASSLLLAVVATAFGCFAGALGTGGDDAVSLGDLVAVLFVAVGVLIYSAPTIGATALYAVPILGQVLVVRDAISGSPSIVEVALALASGAATFALLVGAAGRLLDDDKRLARAVR